MRHEWSPSKTRGLYSTIFRTSSHSQVPIVGISPPLFTIHLTYSLIPVLVSTHIRFCIVHLSTILSFKNISSKESLLRIARSSQALQLSNRLRCLSQLPFLSFLWENRLCRYLDMLLYGFCHPVDSKRIFHSFFCPCYSLQFRVQNSCLALFAWSYDCLKIALWSTQFFHVDLDIYLCFLIPHIARDFHACLPSFHSPSHYFRFHLWPLQIDSKASPIRCYSFTCASNAISLSLACICSSLACTLEPLPLNLAHWIEIQPSRNYNGNFASYICCDYPLNATCLSQLEQDKIKIVHHWFIDF